MHLACTPNAQRVKTLFLTSLYLVVLRDADPSRLKKGKDVLQGLKTIIKDGFKVNMVRTDRGMEFRSKEVNA